MTRYLAAGAAAFILATAASAQEQQQVGMQDVPHAAMAAARQAAGTTEFQAVGLDLDDGQATWELSTKSGDGKGIEVDVTAEGMVVEVEYETAEDEVPQRVMDLLRKYFPDMQPATIERSVRKNFVTFYEFEGEANGSEVDVEVRNDGRMLVIQDDGAG